MPGDSEEDFIEHEAEDEGSTALPTAEELRTLRLLGRQHPPAPPAKTPPDEADWPDRPQGREGPTGFLPPATPLRPTPAPMAAEAEKEPEESAYPELAPESSQRPRPTQPVELPPPPPLDQTAPTRPLSQSASSTHPLPPPAFFKAPPQPFERTPASRASTQPLPPPGPTRAATQPMVFSRRRPAPAGSVPASALASNSPGGFDWAGFRHQSVWLIPPVLVGVFFTLVAIVSLHQAAALPPRAIWAMLFIFAALGVLESGALFFVRGNEYAWAVGAIAGVGAFVAVTFFALFGIVFGCALSLVLAVLLGVVLHDRYEPVKAGTVVVLGRFGKPTRTLHPGFNLRAPGEQVLGVVDQQRLRDTVRLASLRLVSGEHVTLEVALSYQVIPGQEQLAVQNTNDWHLPIQQHLRAVVEDVVSMLSADDLRAPAGSQLLGPLASGVGGDGAEGHPSPLARINDLLTRTMSEQVTDRGVRVHAVKVHILEGPRAPDHSYMVAQPSPAPHPTVALKGMPPEAGRIVEGTIQTLPQLAAPSPWMALGNGMVVPPAGTLHNRLPGSEASPFLPVPPGVPSDRAGAPGQISSRPPLLKAQQLAQTYQDIMDEQITDPTMIRRIIAQFDAVAADPVLSAQVKFDAARGAQQLRDHLGYLERHAPARPDASPSLGASPTDVSGDPFFPPRKP